MSKIEDVKYFYGFNDWRCEIMRKSKIADVEDWECEILRMWKTEEYKNYKRYQRLKKKRLRLRLNDNVKEW